VGSPGAAIRGRHLPRGALTRRAARCLCRRPGSLDNIGQLPARRPGSPRAIGHQGVRLGRRHGVARKVGALERHPRRDGAQQERQPAARGGDAFLAGQERQGVILTLEGGAGGVMSRILKVQVESRPGGVAFSSSAVIRTVTVDSSTKGTSGV